MAQFDDGDIGAREAEIATPEDLDAYQNPSPSAGDDGDDGGEPTSRAEKRIKGLLKKNSELMNEFTRLREEFAEYKAQGGHPAPAVPQPNGGEKGVEDLSDGDLRNALENGAHDPQIVIAVTKELARRAAAEEAGKVRGEFETATKTQARIQEAWSEVRNMYGDSAFQKDSPLRQSAEIIAAGYRKKLGDDVFEKQPELLTAVFGTAYGQRAGGAVKHLQNENAKLRAQVAQLQGPGRAAERSAEQNAAISSHLEKGDVRGAIGELSLLKKLRSLGS